jgi:outer membrane receptor protein involved in Fe transport
MPRHILRTTPLLALVAALVFGSPPLQAGTTGKLSGRVTNEKKEPLTGANVRIEGQRLGAISDDEGNYFVLGVPAGVYTVRVNLLGHAPLVVENVQIQPDFTTELDLTLRTEAVQMSEVRVEAERPLLQKDATGTTRFISSEDIAKLPTRGYRDAAAQQTGVVNFQRNIDTEAQNSNTLIVRGGRPNEVAYYVDGFSQQDPLTGTSSTSISNNSIEEVVVLTGGFNAEYGRIMSGAVNVITREGQSRYFGGVEAVSDVLSGDWIGSEQKDYNIYDASLGGPVIPGNDDLTFYVSGERRWQGDRQPGFMLDNVKSQYADLGLDDAIKPNNSSGGFTMQAKLAWQLGQSMNVKLGGLGSQELWRQYAHAYLFDLDHTARYEDRNTSYFGTFNHVLSPKTFYNVGVNFFETHRKRGDGLAFDNLDPGYTWVDGGTILSEDGQIVSDEDSYYRQSNPRFNADAPMFWNDGHVFDDFLQRRSSYYGAQASLTSQVDAHHQLKFGGDYQRHTLRYFNHFFPVQLGGASPNLTDFDAYGYDLEVDYRDVMVMDVTDGDTTFTPQRVATGIRLVENDDDDQDGPKHPKTFSVYLQDKFEREGVIVNGGLRYDYINVDTPALASDQLPLGDPDSDALPDSLETDELVDNKTYSRISPRLGVAFPVDERTLLRFNYGQFYQQPNLQDLYVSYRFLQYKIVNGGYFVGFGNPNLKPERTTAYEVGIARQLGDNVRLDLTAYYKDVKDLVEITTVPSFPNNFSSFRNRDYATIKGLDIGFTMRPINNISANLAYSLSSAMGTGSVSRSQTNVAWQSTEPPKQTSPLDFDQRHKMSLNLDWRLGAGAGPMFGNVRWFENTGINVLFNVASGTPYTPTFPYNELTLAAVAGVPSGPLNSRYGPWTSNLDLKATRGFGFGGLHLEAFAWVLNVFDTQNPITVYQSTGSSETTGFLNTEDGTAYLDGAAAAGLDGEALYRLAESNPNLYSNPRLVRFGLRANF